MLELLEESSDLNKDQILEKLRLVQENYSILDQEEKYWINRDHDSWLLKGDNNTSYFHMNC